MRREVQRPGLDGRAARRAEQQVPSSTSRSAAASPKFTATSRSPRRIVKTRVSSSAVQETELNDGSVSAGSVRRSSARRRYAASSCACRPPVLSDQSSFERVNVSGSCGSGTASGSQPILSNSRIRPSAVARPSSGSGCEVKNWNGRRGGPLLALEQHRRERPGQGQQRGAGQLVDVEHLGGAVAAGAVADLVVVLVADHQPPGRHRRGVDRDAVVALAERGEGAVVEEAALADLRQRRERLEVGVVALGLAGQRHVHRVVEVVAPLRVQPVAARLARRHQHRVVQVGLGDQGQRPTDVRRERSDLDGQLLEQVGLRGVARGRARRRAGARRRGSRAATSARCRGCSAAPPRDCSPSRLTRSPQVLAPSLR